MRKVFWVLGLVVVACIVWFLFFTPFQVQKKVEVPFSMFKVGEQFSNLEKLEKWYLPFAVTDTSEISKVSNKHFISTGDHSVEVSDITMFSSLITASSKNQKKSFLFTAVTDSLNPGISLVTLSYKTSLYKKWLAKSSLEKDAEKSLERLKDYMTDTKRFYGYEIRPVTVSDTAFLFLRETVPLEKKRTATRDMFERLISFAEKRNAGYNGVRIFYSLRSGDEITLFASIGVTTRIEIEDDQPIQYKMMPFEKNLLEASYQGPYGESEKVFKALEQFKTDHNLTSMAIPFQKFLSDGYDFADDQIVQLKIYSPVF